MLWFTDHKNLHRFRLINVAVWDYMKLVDKGSCDDKQASSLCDTKSKHAVNNGLEHSLHQSCLLDIHDDVMWCHKHCMMLNCSFISEQVRQVGIVDYQSGMVSRLDAYTRLLQSQHEALSAWALSRGRKNGAIPCVKTKKRSVHAVRMIPWGLFLSKKSRKEKGWTLPR